MRRYWRRWVVVFGLVAAVVAALAAFGVWFPDMRSFVADPGAGAAYPSAVRHGLWFDSLVFVPLYLIVTSLGCVLPTRDLVRYRSVGRRLAGLAYLAAAADVLENMNAFALLHGDRGTERWLRYATAAKLALIAVPASFALCALLAWAGGLTNRRSPQAAAVTDALEWARRQRGVTPPSGWRRLRCWVVGDRPSEPEVPPPARAVPAGLTGVCFSGGGIRSAAYNLGALQELQASGELGRADVLASVSGGSYIATAHAVTAAFSDRELLGTVPPFAPGSVEEEYLRNRTTYLFPGLAGTAVALWRLVRGLAVNVGFIVAVLFILARPYGWLVGPNLRFDCRQVEGATTTTVVSAGPPAACPPRPADAAGRPTKRKVTFDTFDWAVWPVAIAGGLAVGLGLVDLLLRPKDRAAGRLEAWSFRMLGLALLCAAFLYALPWLAARLFTDTTYHASALDRLPAGAAILGALSSLLTMVALLRRSGPKPPTGETDSGTSLGLGRIARRIKAGAAKAGDGVLRLLMTVVGGVVGPLALGAAFLALAMGSMVEPRLDPGQFGGWLLAITVLVLVQGVGDANRWSLQPYYKRRLQTAFVLRRTCSSEGGVMAEAIPFDDRIALTSLLDTPRLVICAAANLNTYGLTPPGRGVSTFTFSRQEVDAGILGRVPTPTLATLLGPHYARDFTVPAATAASGAAVSPVMGKMTKPAYRFLLALTNVRLGVWLPNPTRVVAWAQEQPLPRLPADPSPGGSSPDVDGARARLADAEAAEARVRAEPGDGPDREAEVQAARMETERRRRALESALADLSPPTPDFAGYPWLPRPSLLFRELFGFYRSTSRFVYVTDGGHYENLGLVELIRRGCRLIYCFDAAGDRVDQFTTVADAVAIARTELGVRIRIDPTRMAPPPESEFNATDCVVGTFSYAGHENDPGCIVFAKLGVVADVPADVRSWRETHPTFPTDGTADQLYTDQRFEAYRALGAGTAVRAIALMRHVRGDSRPVEAGPLRRGHTGCPPPTVS
ncbi:MAG TPA: hypothetical protein VHT97_09405 [Acidimicrobiales bacterium]|nr:hypothetical protein [Acidimicrobiales bacterium]